MREAAGAASFFAARSRRRNFRRDRAAAVPFAAALRFAAAVRFAAAGPEPPSGPGRARAGSGEAAVEPGTVGTGAGERGILRSRRAGAGAFPAGGVRGRRS